MHGLRIFAFGQFLVSIATTTSSGEQPALTTEALLAGWETASQMQAVDARFTRTEYDTKFRDEQQTLGRFYWEASGGCFYETEGRRVRYSIIWSADTLCLIEQAKNQKNYLKCSKADVQEAHSHLNELEALSGWQSLLHCFDRLRWFPGCFATPEDVLPLCTKIEAETIQKRFDLKWREEEDKIIVTARPQDAKDVRIRQIDVMLARGTYKLLAHRKIDTHGQSVVHVFDEVKLNKVPDDRESHMNPNLDEFGPLFGVEAMGTPPTVSR